MQLVAQVPLQIPQRVIAIVCGRPYIRSKIWNGLRMGPNGFEQVRPMFDICQLSQYVGQTRFGVAEQISADVFADLRKRQIERLAPLSHPSSNAFNTRFGSNGSTR